MQDVSIDDVLAKTFHVNAEATLVFYSVSGCTPCETMERAILSLEMNRRNDMQLLRVKLNQEDKRELGKAVLNGVSSFPRLDLFAGQELSRSMIGAAMSADDRAVEETVARFVSQKSI